MFVHLSTERACSCQPILKEALIPNQEDEDGKYVWPGGEISGLGVQGQSHLGHDMLESGLSHCHSDLFSLPAPNY